MHVNGLRAKIEGELRGNILPFWMDHVVDYRNGGFYGRVDNDLTVRNEVETVSSSQRAHPVDICRGPPSLRASPSMNRWPKRPTTTSAASFRDRDHGGVYWSVDAAGRPVNDRKHVYAQAFTIYGLAEYARATSSREALEWAHELFALVEVHTYDERSGGNVESRARDWSPLADMRLSDKEPPATKTMNTLLHLMEAYTNLRRVSDDPLLSERHKALAPIVRRAGAWISEYTRLRLFFDSDWRPLPDHVSPGHDIEGELAACRSGRGRGATGSLLAQTRASGGPDRRAGGRRLASTTRASSSTRRGRIGIRRGTGGRRQRGWWVSTTPTSSRAPGAFEMAAERLWELIEQPFRGPAVRRVVQDHPARRHTGSESAQGRTMGMPLPQRPRVPGDARAAAAAV